PSSDPDPSPTDDDGLIQRIRKSKQSAKFRAFFDQGDITGYGSQSEADAALLEILAFWTERDAGRMERLFDRSALGRRAKWTKRSDYRKASIDSAIAACAETKKPRRARRGSNKAKVPISDAFSNCAVTESGQGDSVKTARRSADMTADLLKRTGGW